LSPTFLWSSKLSLYQRWFVNKDLYALLYAQANSTKISYFNKKPYKLVMYLYKSNLILNYFVYFVIFYLYILFSFLFSTGTSIIPHAYVT